MPNKGLISDVYSNSSVWQVPGSTTLKGTNKEFEDLAGNIHPKNKQILNRVLLEIFPFLCLQYVFWEVTMPMFFNTALIGMLEKGRKTLRFGSQNHGHIPIKAQFI